MLSVYIYTGIVCLIFYFLIKNKSKIGAFGGYSALEMSVFFALTRICPLFMPESRTYMNYAAFAADIAVLAAVSFLFYRKFGAEKAKNAAALYMFAPLPIMAISSCDLRYTAASLVIAVLVFFAYKAVKKRSSESFLNEYILLVGGEYAVLGGIMFLSGKSLAAAVITGCIAAALAVILALKKLSAKNKCKAEKSASTGDAEVFSHEKFGGKDVILMLILTGIYAVGVFFRLGSFEAPQTQMIFSEESGKKDIVLDLGEYADVSQISFFLGVNKQTNIAVSAFDEADDKWVLIDRQAELNESFRWDSVSVGWNLRYIGIVFTEPEKCYVREIVVVGTDGEPMLPVNSADYPELFDEQELYPEYNSYYYGMMFDESYHGRTAYEFLNGLPIFEDTHPPLGKTIISLGIATFGMTPFGWRFASAVCGVLAVPLMYLFCRRVTGRTDMSFVGTALFCMEFMHYTLSRIATIDMIAALFILMMFFFMYCFTQEKNRAKQYVWLILCGISTALAVSTKWTGVYAALGIAVIFFANVLEKCGENGGLKKNIPYLAKLFGVCVGAFIVIPAAVYSLSYIQFSKVYTDKNFIEHAVSNSISMFEFHSCATASHPYSSEWYEWLIDKQPVLITFSHGENGAVSSAAMFGQPLILLVGIAAFLHNFYLWRVKGSRTSRVLVIAFLSMLMPWLFIHRTVFIYQYFVCITLFCPMICRSLAHLKKPMLGGALLLGGSMALFIMFFPVISGTWADREYIEHWLEWLPTWVFE